MNGLLRNIERILRNRRTRRMLQRTISMFAAIVVFFTTYALVLPAITMEKTAGCGIEEHQHDDSCYEDQLICGLEESEEHQHTADCYERVLVCGKEAHTHSAACYPAEAEAEVETGADENTGNTVAVDATANTDGTVTGDTAGNGADTYVETTEGGETEVPASDFSDTTVVIDPSDPSGQVTEDPAAMAADPAAAAVAYPAVIFDDAINVRSTGLNTDTEIGTESGLQTLVDETSLFVHVEADEETFPEGTTMVLSEVTDDTIDTVATAVEGALSAQDAAANAQQAEDASKAQTRTHGFHALDISFYDLEGNKIEPLRPVRVSITSDAIRTAVQDETTVPVVVHVEDQTTQTTVSDNADGAAAAAETAAAGPDTALNSTVVEAAETTEAAATGRQEAAADAGQALDTLTFEAGAFSVYAIVYTVDFHWEVDGKSYDFNIPGGGFASFYNLVKDLGIAADNAETAQDEIQELVDGVEKIEFSNPELVSVSKTEENTTVGAIKDGLGLECEYSAGLTEGQIAEINAQEVFAGDWALISLKPFDTEESMTVTMKNGDAWSVKVTDAQISGHFISDSGKLFEVTVTYDEAANIPEGSTLKVTEFSEDDAKYDYARNSVLADKKARGEWVDLSSFNLAALDISILNPDGEEIEPEAPVQVEIRIKELPGVEDLSEVKDTLAIQHHVEVEDGVVVETVFDGNTEASFKLKTNETVATEGTVVDPDSVSEQDFLPNDDTAEIWDETSLDDSALVVSFESAVFSTFTVSWGNPIGGNAGTYAHIHAGNSLVNNQKYIIYGWDAADNKYYAIVPSSDLHTVEITLDDNNIVQYTGEEDLYWTVNTGYEGYDTYYSFSFSENGHSYYLTEGSSGAPLSLSDSQHGYDSSRTTMFRQYNGYLHSAYNTFMRCENGVFKVVYQSGFNQWNSSLIYFERQGVAVPSYPYNVTVHYVDENDNEITISNPASIYSNLNVSSPSPAYLIYDIDGYEYSYTYKNSKSDRISPLLVRNRTNNRWMYNPRRTGRVYYSDYTPEYEGTALSNGDDIYVVYKRKNDITQGGTPTVKQSGDVDPPVAPRINKESTPNGDDTNTLALSLISDTAKLEVEKLADVIVVFDVSGSMNTDDMENDKGENESRLQAAKTAVNNLAEDLSEKKNSAGEPLVRMSLIQFSTKASKVVANLTDLNDDGKTAIQTAVNNLSADGGTNWDHALQLANEENDLDPGRATFVIFVTDGDPTYRNTRMNATDLDLQGETNDTSLSNGWVNPNQDYLDNNVYGPGDNDKTGQCYAAAVEQGEAIVAAGKNIFTIGISNDVKKVETFNTDIHGNGAFIASNSGALQRAFADIETSISGFSGWGNIQMTDGITNLTNTVQKTGLINVGGDFTYWKAPAPENWASMSDAEKNAYKPAADDYEEWDPVAAGAALAQYNEQTGAVVWNMGDKFMPEAGVTYQVRFKVWPSQEAYDYIAKLNNGTIAYDTLPSDVKAQIIKSGNTYTLKTNEPDAKTTYQTAVKTGNTVTTSGEPKTLMFPTVENLNLSVDKMKVKKEWVNSLDPDSRWKSDVTLLLTDGAGNLYKSIELNEENKYTAEDNFISCGLAKIENNELVIYEQGHDFKLTEPDDYAYYWDLDSQIYRPMIINATLTMLIKADAPAGMGNQTYYVDQGTTYYKIGDGTYKAISTGDSAATITATNIRRSNLNLTKKVVDKDGRPVISSEAFTFTITINDTHEDQVWFSVQRDANDTGTIVKDLSTDATPQVEEGEKTGYYYASSGSPITVSIEPGWNLRFTNLPNGTTYTITENPKENYSFVDAEIDNDGTFSLNEGTATGNGTIKESDHQYTVTYTNKAETQEVNILKTSQDGTTPLPGAVFSLYTKSGYEADPKLASRTDLTSDANGKIELGALACGMYYLEETSAPAGYIILPEPVTITVSNAGVTYKQSDNSMSQSGEGISHKAATDPYTLTVTNNAGYELPSTGGPGTRLFTILGTALIAGAGLLLWMTRKSPLS